MMIIFKNHENQVFFQTCPTLNDDWKSWTGIDRNINIIWNIFYRTFMCLKIWMWKNSESTCRKRFNDHWTCRIIMWIGNYNNVYSLDPHIPHIFLTLWPVPSTNYKETTVKPSTTFHLRWRFTLLFNSNYITPTKPTTTTLVNIRV